MAGCAMTHHQHFVFCRLSKCKFISTSVQGLDFPVELHFPLVAQTQVLLGTYVLYQHFWCVDSLSGLHIVASAHGRQYQQGHQLGSGDKEPRQEPQKVVC